MLLALRDDVATMKGDLNNVNSNVSALIPEVFRLTIGADNLWTPSKRSGSRNSHYRKALSSLLKCGKNAVCSVTGQSGNGEQVVCGYLVPCRSDLRKLKVLGLESTDLNKTENCIFWAKGFERCYEHLRISFVKPNPLSDDLVLKFWDESAKLEPLWSGSADKLGDYDGFRLNWGPRTIFKRALSFQAYQGYLHNLDGSALTDTDSLLYGSPGKYSFFKNIELLKKGVIKDIETEVGDDEER